MVDQLSDKYQPKKHILFALLFFCTTLPGMESKRMSGIIRYNGKCCNIRKLKHHSFRFDDDGIPSLDGLKWLFRSDDNRIYIADGFKADYITFKEDVQDTALIYIEYTFNNQLCRWKIDSRIKNSTYGQSYLECHYIDN